MRIILLMCICINTLYGQLLDFSSNVVLDKANILSASQEAHLTKRVKDCMEKTSMEIKIVTIENTKPYKTASDYTEALYHKWKLGDKQTHNGLLLLIAKNINSNSKDMKDYCRIMTGWGIINIIPDEVVINTIKHKHMMVNLPHQPFLAFDNSLDVIFKYINEWQSKNPKDLTVNIPADIRAKYKVKDAISSTNTTIHNDNSNGNMIIFLIIVFIIVILVYWWLSNSEDDDIYDRSSKPSSSSSSTKSSSSSNSYNSNYNDYNNTSSNNSNYFFISSNNTTSESKSKSSDSPSYNSCSSTSCSSTSSSDSSSSSSSCSSGSSCSSSSCSSSSCGGGGCGGGGCGS